MATKKVIIDDKAIPVEDTKVTFPSIGTPTPQWAKNVINITTRVTAAFAIFLAATNLIGEEWKFEILLGLKALDFLVVEIGKLFGLVEK